MLPSVPQCTWQPCDHRLAPGVSVSTLGRPALWRVAPRGGCGVCFSPPVFDKLPAGSIPVVWPGSGDGSPEVQQRVVIREG